MDAQSYLNPTDIKTQCKEAIKFLEEDNASLTVAVQSINQFIENDEIKSTRFGNLKQQMRDYVTAAQTMININNLDIADYNSLKELVGNEELDGQTIMYNKQHAEAVRASNESIAGNYRNLRGMCGNNILLYTYYGIQASHYEHVAQMYEKIYDKWQEKEDTYDSINQSTAELFVKQSAMRDVVTECLNDIQSSFTSVLFAHDMGAGWRFALSGDGRRESLDRVTENDMQEIIAIYETMHPETAEQLNALLINENCEMLTNEDIENIKYLAYTAEEPYRSLYLNHIGEYTIGQVDKNVIVKKSRYRPEENDIIYMYPAAFAADDRGPYTIFFHECGHATDNHITEGEFSLVYRYWDEETRQEYSLQELIEEDVYNNIRERIREQDDTLTDEQIEQILDSLKYGGTEEELSSSKLREIRNSVINEYNKEFKLTEMEAVSDVYGGVTNLNIGNNGRFGHKPEYKEDISDFDYWYMDGEPTGAQSKELWAEYFSFYMAGDEEALEKLREYYPSASQVLDAMAEEMAGY